MKRRSGLGETGKLLSILSAILIAGFGLSSVFSYFAARDALRASLAERELPAAIDGIYEHIQRDIVRPVVISSMMADDEFLHEWILEGEKDQGRITRYLSEVKRRYGAYSSFFVSERSGRYYTGEGTLKVVSEKEPRDEWYFRVRGMKEPYELNVDPDLANGDAITLFINYRVISSKGEFLGAAGVGITMSSLDATLAGYSADYGVNVYFSDEKGRIVAGSPSLISSSDVPRLGEVRGLEGFDPRDSGKPGDYAAEFERSGRDVFLIARKIPELKWWLFAEKPEQVSVKRIESAIWWNIAVGAIVMVIVLILASLTVRRYQSRLENTASTDRLTGVMNRYAFEYAAEAVLKRCEREILPFSAIMIDIDDFKSINDRFGHLAGDAVLKAVAEGVKSSLRASDLLCRWGGEEFLIAVPDCLLEQAADIAEKLRAAVAARTRPIARLTVSAGVAELRRAETFESLTRRADQALLEAKRSGKDRVSSSN